MNYVVVVLDPVPQDLSSAAAKVAEGFRIPADKAMALLQRAPGAVTRDVPERQARSVAKILHAAGFEVELREGGVDGARVPWPDDHAPVTDTGAGVEPAPRASAVDRPHAVALQERDEDTWSHEPDQEAHEYAVDDEEEVDGPHQVSDTERFADRERAIRDSAVRTGGREAPLAAPLPGHTVPQPPRDPMKTTLTREPPQLDRHSLRRRIATAATLPALLTLLVMLLALSVTLLPVLRAEQARRAGEVATAMAATIEGMSRGLPLSAPVTVGELERVAELSRTGLAGRGVSFMAVLNPDGTPLVAWEGPGQSGGLSPAAADLARARAADARGVDVAVEPWLDSLKVSWQGLLAMVGLAQEPLVAAAAPVSRGDVRLGTVVVAVDPSALRSSLGQVLLTTLLVGLIPVLFAVLAALSLTRGLTSAISYLLVAADRISHGDFEHTVELRRDDELGQIAGAIDRMRISLREGMERLRRRR